MSKYKRGAYHFEEFRKDTLYRRHVNALLQEMILYEPATKILDLGGGEGLIASKLAALGYDIESWEIDSYALALAAELKTPVRRGDMVVDEFPEGIDLVLAADSLEHLTVDDRDRVLLKCQEAGVLHLTIYIPDRPDAHASDQPSKDQMIQEAADRGYRLWIEDTRFARHLLFFKLRNP